jgi:rod shape determining protein RodA
MLAVGLADYRAFRAYSKLLYAGVIALLLVVLVTGRAVRGSTAWIHVFGGAIQPVEFAKLALVLALARFFSKHMGEAGRWRPFMISGVWLLALAGLVMLQPDLGSAVILVVIWLTLLFFFGASKRQWLLLIGGGLALAATAWFAFLSPYQKARVETFLNPAADPLGSGYNVRQSIVAVGSGQVAGRGIGLGSQSQLNFLPEQYTDFIFSAIAEELGLLGSATILVLLGTMLYRLVIIARRSEDDFGTLVALGLAGWLGVQAFINLGGALGLLPLTGLTLPLVSAGGSSLIAVLVSLGVAQSIALRGRQGFG